jgi:hypothetical protein
MVAGFSMPEMRALKKSSPTDTTPHNLGNRSNRPVKEKVIDLGFFTQNGSRYARW